MTEIQTPKNRTCLKIKLWVCIWKTSFVLEFKTMSKIQTVWKSNSYWVSEIHTSLDFRHSLYCTFSFFKVWLIGPIFTPAHILYSTYRHTFSQTFKEILIFWMFLHGDVDHGHLWREESHVPQSPVSWIVTWICTHLFLRFHDFLLSHVRWVTEVGPTERCGRLLNVLTLIPASSGLRDGLTWDWYRMFLEKGWVCVELIVELGS